MHSNVTVKNVSWPHFSWPTLYIDSNLQSVVSKIWQITGSIFAVDSVYLSSTHFFGVNP